MRWLRDSLTLIALLGAATAGHAVDGVLEINQACALNTGCFTGDTAGFPVTITTSGSYRLTGSLLNEVDFNAPAIEITAGAVALDLNGFEIRSVGPESISGPSASVSVMNGTIGPVSLPNRGGIRLGFGSSLDRMKVSGVGTASTQGGFTVSVVLGDGCHLTRSTISAGTFGLVETGSQCHVSGNTISSASSTSALVVGSGSVVTDNILDGDSFGVSCSSGGCTISGNIIRTHEVGIFAVDSVVSNNTLRGSAQPNAVGISCLHCTVIGNVVNDHTGLGLRDTSGTSGYANNQFNNNNGGNANPQVSGGIEMGTNICGGDTTCP